jgi:hypothetical protein
MLIFGKKLAIVGMRSWRLGWLSGKTDNVVVVGSGTSFLLGLLIVGSSSRI